MPETRTSRDRPSALTRKPLGTRRVPVFRIDVRVQVAHDARRHARYQAVGRDITRYYRTRADDGSGSDANAGQNNHPRREPRTVADLDRPVSLHS